MQFHTIVATLLATAALTSAATIKSRAVIADSANDDSDAQVVEAWSDTGMRQSTGSCNGSSCKFAGMALFGLPYNAACKSGACHHDGDLCFMTWDGETRCPQTLPAGTKVVGGTVS